jgi:hypothetical protein
VSHGFVNTIPSPKTPADSNDFKVGNASTKAQHLWHHSVDKNHFFFHVKIEVKYIIFLRGNACSTKRDAFHGGSSIAFLKKRSFKKLGHI